MREGSQGCGYVSTHLILDAHIARVGLLAKSDPEASRCRCRASRASVNAVLGLSGCAIEPAHHETFGAAAFAARWRSIALEFPEFQRRLEAFCFSVGIYAFFTISGGETPPARTAKYFAPAQKAVRNRPCSPSESWRGSSGAVVALI